MSVCQSCGGVIGRECFNPVECAMITQAMIVDDAVQRAMYDRDVCDYQKHCEREYEEHLRAEYYEHIGFDPIEMGM